MRKADDLLDFLIAWWTAVGIFFALIMLFNTTTIEYNNKKRALYKQNVINNTNNFYRNVR